MRKTLSILVPILLGALAVAIGMGGYLKQANDDRERLAGIAKRAQDEVTRIKEEGRFAVDQANKKIAQADIEISKAQKQVQLAQQERDLMASAQQLLPPNGKTIKGWKDAINLPLGISLKYPQGTEIESNDAQSLTLLKTIPNSILPAQDQRWLSITPFDEKLEQELLFHLSSSTNVSYSVHGRLLAGKRGQLNGQTGYMTVLHVRSAGTSSHLIWIKEPVPTNSKITVTDILSTIDFSR
ncbi:hypothetical protein IT408_00815 [Candidatus Uhrbacteria bacterium]|nr:hypothetical protein [Candidatus Uhrbacteria bacterium]